MKPAYVDLEPDYDLDGKADADQRDAGIDPIGIGPQAYAAREQEHANHTLACKRMPIKTLLKSPALRAPLTRFMEATLMHNQQVRGCCRNAENHDIAAWYSSPADAARGVPDIYIIHCECGRQHRYFCVGGTECPPMDDKSKFFLRHGRVETAEEHTARLASSKRPFWDAR